MTDRQHGASDSGTFDEKKGDCTHHNRIRHLALNLGRRVALGRRRQQALVVPLLALDAEAHDVALVEVEVCVVVAPDVDLFVVFAVRGLEVGPGLKSGALRIRWGGDMSIMPQ